MVFRHIFWCYRCFPDELLQRGCGCGLHILPTLFLNKALLILASYLPITEVHGTVAILVSVDRLLRAPDTELNLTTELILIYSGDDGLSALANQNLWNDPFISDEPISL